MFSLTPGVVKFLAFAAVVVLCLLGLSRYNAHQQQIGYDKAKAEYTALMAEKVAAAAKETAALNTQLEVARNDAVKREQALRSVAAASAASDARLRNTVADLRSRLSNAPAEAARNAASALADVFGDCEAKYRELAEIADRHASDVKTLMDAP